MATELDWVVIQYFWIRKRNLGILPAVAWAGAMQVIKFFREEFP